MIVRHRALAAALLAGACATPGQVRRVETQVAVLQRDQQRADSARSSELARMLTLQQHVMDSLVSLSRVVGQGQRDVAAEFTDVQRQLLAVRTLTGETQARLNETKAAIDARLDAQAIQQPMMMDSTRPSPVSGQPSEVQLYETGRRQLDQNSYTTARTAFRDLLRLYPTSSYAPDAFYGLAQTFEGTRQTDSARTYYVEVTRNFPSSMRAAAALYKLGMLALNRGDRASARAYFQQVVVDRYRSAAEYPLAQQKLRELP